MDSKLLKLTSAIGVCLLVGITGGIFTADAIPTWYVTLNKPFFNPPNWVFGPVWTILYILMGVSLYSIWVLKGKEKQKAQAIRYFFLQLGLNFFWSIAFFGAKDPFLALLIIIGMWISIVITLRAFLVLDKRAGYLLIPYLAWVSFASLLNASIVYLN